MEKIEWSVWPPKGVKFVHIFNFRHKKRSLHFGFFLFLLNPIRKSFPADDDCSC